MPIPTSVPFGHYLLEALLGAGAMARVYRAEYCGAGGFRKPCAVKILQKTASGHTETDLANEARIGGRLKHDNIGQVYELGREGGQTYIAMELIEGWSLQTVLEVSADAHWPLPSRLAVDIMVAVCDALAYAHDLSDAEGASLNLVHRDLKPGNIMVSATGDVKVLDFGIALHGMRIGEQTIVGTVKGSPGYMSPEQATGRALDRRSDIFALGTILYELVMTRAAFNEDDSLKTMMKIVRGDHSAETEAFRAVCPELASVLEHAWQKHPDDRYHTAAAMRDDLRKIADTLPIAAPDLRGWLGTMSSCFPRPRKDGDFGKKGPPDPVEFDAEDRHTIIELPTPHTMTIAVLRTFSEEPSRFQREAERLSVSVPGGEYELEQPPTLTADGLEVFAPDAIPRRPFPRAAAAVLCLAVLVATLAFVIGTSPEEGTKASKDPRVSRASTSEMVEDGPVLDLTPLPPAAETSANVSSRGVRGPRLSSSTPLVIPGFLSASSLPDAEVFVDGSSFGMTPVLDLPLTPGSHTILLRCRDCAEASERSFSITGASGKTIKLFADFSAP